MSGPRQHLLPLLGLTLVAFFLSIPSLHYGYLLEDYKYLRSYTIDEILTTFHSHWEPTMKETRGYRPLHSVHYAIFHLLIGGDPVKNHILAIILFISGALLLYALALRCTNDQSAAFWSALIYPCLGTMAWQVSWLVSRQHLLLIIFFLVFLIQYDRYLRTGSRFSWFLSCLFFLLGLLLKETAVTFPFIVLAFSLIVRKKTVRSQAKPLLPFFLLLAIYLLLRTSFIRTVSESNLLPPPPSHNPGELLFQYNRGLFSTLVQSHGIRDPKNDFPIYDADIVTPRNFLGMLGTAGFFSIAGALLILHGSEKEKRAFLFGLAVLLIANIMVAAWFRSNRFFISSVGVAIMVGVLVATVFSYLTHQITLRRMWIGALALLFFGAYLAVNLSVFTEIQWALRPDGFVARTWNEWVYEDYLPYMKEEQLRLFADQLRVTGREEWADRVLLKSSKQ